MSLILEALRKSEAERRRGEMPDLRAELPPPVGTRRAGLRKTLPWIALALAAGIALAFALHPWTRSDTATPAPAASTPETTIAPPESIRMQSRPQAAVAPRVETMRVETPRVAARETPQPQPAPAIAEPAPADEAPAQAAVAGSAPSTAPATANAAETTVGALPADLRKALPPLQLSMHMWDPDPAKRFVILDGERRVEGDSVGPMRIRRIDANGVLFDWQGRPVRLPLR
jgi:general secretion pathway protein B